MESRTHYFEVYIIDTGGHLKVINLQHSLTFYRETNFELQLCRKLVKNIGWTKILEERMVISDESIDVSQSLSNVPGLLPKATPMVLRIAYDN